MFEIEEKTSLIRTKLNRPPLPVCMVKRARLTSWLSDRLERPLTLVTAPAGYGKSTLISCWLETVDQPAAWVSLDEHDNELGNFLSYFLAAIRTIHPNAVQETESFLNVIPKPPVEAVAHTLLNELNQIEEPFILVFDDYHLIENREIHDLISEFLQHPPRNFHLVLGTRMDPPLPLVRLRATGMMTEVRIMNLRFNQEESLSLIEQMLSKPVDRAMLSELEKQSEGWVTGLRLAALAMNHQIDQDRLFLKVSPNNRYVTEYLVTEILEKQTALWADWLIRTSILERFCADLCGEICSQFEEEPGLSSTDYILSEDNHPGESFIKWLKASNLFVIPLDNEGKWFRFHHLFRDFLHQELEGRFSQKEIDRLHSMAGGWLSENGLFEEALYHLMAAGDQPAAIQLVAEQRYHLMNTIQWPRLERWLSLFPLPVVESSAELWMIKTWLIYQSGQWNKLPNHIQHIASRLELEADQASTSHLAGEIYALRSLVSYHQTDAEGTIFLTRKALEMIPSMSWIIRVFARLYLAGSLLMVGEENKAFHALYDAFDEEKENVQNKRFKATLLTVACYIHWLTADLQSIVQAAKQAIILCKDAGHRQILSMANYHLGCTRYQQNDLAAAEELFASITTRPYENYGTVYTNSVCGLGITYQAQGRDTEAEQVIERGLAFYLETGNTTQLPMIQALQAEVSLRQGKLSSASQWAERLAPIPPFMPVWGFFAPHLTLIKVCLAQNTIASRKKAASLLNRIHEYFQNTHNTRFLIETLALKALFENVNRDSTAAMDALEQALRLAQSGGFIRLFVDTGSQMRELLNQIEVDKDLENYIERILSAFIDTTSRKVAMSALMENEKILEALTTRELEVLELLGERLSNKEIAAQLVISPGTVKGHTIQIYKKLGVTGRREAVEKAAILGIISTK